MEFNYRKPEVVAVEKIFEGVKYKVPIYQRNYSWQEKEIHQLIEDILNTYQEEYFLGNLIINQNVEHLEVIDGQQRLTTLYLIFKYLGVVFVYNPLEYEAREKSSKALVELDEETFDIIYNEENKEIYCEQIIEGYRIIREYFKNRKINDEEFKEKLKHVNVVRIQVPKGIDLNHYFEIMNTRGEQLEVHEILKAKLMSKLNTKDEKAAANLIWQACSNMDNYLQMNFSKKLRKEIFSSDVSKLNIDNFDDFVGKISNCENKEITDEKVTIEEILEKKDEFNKNNIKENREYSESERFESIISFPNFILQVNSIENESTIKNKVLDDIEFLENTKSNTEDYEKSKEFLYKLLKCRYLFDRYIIKREYKAEYKTEGKWSLQSFKMDDSINGKETYEYTSTFGEDKDINNKLRTLQSCLRITYTSPKTMEWITKVLRSLWLKENDNIKGEEIINLLEEYCGDKVKESDFKNKSGFEFERIVFTYLDYLLYRDGYNYNDKEIIKPLNNEWDFQYRNSIEHFYPQNDSYCGKNIVKKTNLNKFGNLALITVSGNSKFSNLPPKYKADFDKIIEQSLKLKIMKKLTNDKKSWNNEVLEEHEDEMFKILEKNI